MRNPSFAFSIFEFGNINPVKNIYPIDVIRWTFKYARLADELNFNRLWLAEHYHPHFAWFSPEMLIPLLASSTKNLKIGQAGVILNFKSPLTTSQNFRLLSAFFPERIDLGIAFGKVNKDTAELLFNKDETTDNDFWNKQLDSLYRLVNNSPFETDNYFNKVLIPPVKTIPPSLWFLGASSYQQALKYKGNLCISYFHNPKLIKDRGLLKRFKNDFSEMHGYKPKVSLGIKAFCSNNTDLIREQRKTHEEEEKQRGIKIPFLIGSIEECYSEILNMKKKEEFDEIVLINQIPDFELKMNNLKNFGQLINKEY